MGSGNWIVDNLNSALGTWNGKLAEIWTLLSTGPEEFKGGGVWTVIVGINDGLKAIGYALLVIFFVMGVVKTCGSFTELRKPEQVLKCFVRFALAQAAVSHGMELMTALFTVGQGMVNTIMGASGLSALTDTTLPDEMVAIIEDVSFLDSIPLWAVTLPFATGITMIVFFISTLICQLNYSGENLYPIPQIVLISSPLPPILLRSFFTCVSMVLASPK